MDWHPIQGGIAILSVTSWYKNQVKLQSCGPPRLVCDFYWCEYNFVLPGIFVTVWVSCDNTVASHGLINIPCDIVFRRATAMFLGIQLAVNVVR